ncbi:MAG: ribosome-recycling factor [Chitinophagales bacterium]|nr:ribosome-recycling factor [Chitinophagales bacterium]
MHDKLFKIRGAKPSSAIVDDINIDLGSYNSKLQYIASISINKMSIIITPFNKHDIINIAKSLQKIDVGADLQKDAESVILRFPDITGDSIKKLVKLCESYGEECKISIRSKRKKYIDLLKNITNKNEKDELKSFVENSISKYNKIIEDKIKNKSSDLLKIYNM